jgi:hypothetical protein
MDDLYVAHRHLTTRDRRRRRSAGEGPSLPREPIAGSICRVIRFLTDFQDFSTVQGVPHRRQFRALALGLLFLLGCGPILYVKDVSPRAAAALNQARADQAEQYAPYEYTKASLYYDKAREEAGHAYFQNAVDWGRRSQDCSRRASALARSAQAKHADESQRPNQSCGEL